MQQWTDRDIAPLLKALKECSVSKDLQKGRMIHALSIENGDISNVYVANTLLNMYAKCGSVVEARRVFDASPYRSVVSWNALMFGYADNGQGHKALDVFDQMLRDRCAPTPTTYVAVLKGCIDLASKEDDSDKARSRRMGQLVHAEAVKNRCELLVPVASTLMNMYAKCGCMGEARDIFDRMQHRDVVAWSTLILGYADNGQGETALEMFFKMLVEGCVQDSQTYVAALKACTVLAEKEEPILVNKRLVKLRSQEQGMIIHSYAVHEEGCQYVGSTLIDMYVKCGSVDDARKTFERMRNPSVVPWTALILGYADNGEGETALQLFASMESHGCLPNSRTFIAALKGCIDLATKEEGKRVSDQKLIKLRSQELGVAVHLKAQSRGCIDESFVANTLVDMYAKCGNMVDARMVFERIQHHSVISWTALIQGYADNGEGNASLKLYSRMQREGCVPNSLTYASVLKACCTVAALDFGRAIHAEVSSRCMLDDILVSKIVDFYGKCGSLAEAQQVFDGLTTRDSSCWNALIGAYSRLGDSERVFQLLDKMQEDKVKPDAVTLLCVLTACARAGLVHKGRTYFESMVSKYGIQPDIEHYTCMIDLLGQANELDDALALLKSMPCIPDTVVWKRVLDACCKWKNEEMGKYVFESLMNINAKDAGGYVLMTQIYRSL